jgi:hypothetical protein
MEEIGDLILKVHPVGTTRSRNMVYNRPTFFKLPHHCVGLLCPKPAHPNTHETNRKFQMAFCHGVHRFFQVLYTPGPMRLSTLVLEPPLRTSILSTNSQERNVSKLIKYQLTEVQILPKNCHPFIPFS